MPLSIAAIVTVSDFVKSSLLVVKRRAIVLAEGVRVNVSASALSTRLRRAAHSLTTRREPRKPCILKRGHSSVPFRLPAAHCASSHTRYMNLADRAERLADRVQECTASIFHKLPSISDLHGIRQCPGDRQPVSAATVAGNDLGLGVLPQPSLCRRRAAVWYSATIRMRCRIASPKSVPRE